MAESHAGGQRSLIGGTVESDAPATAALESTLQREIREETTIEIEAEPVYLTSRTFETDDGDRVMNVEFLCRYETGTAVAAQPDELARVDWYEPATLTDHSAVPPWTAAAIERAEQRRQQLGW